ncbi:cation-transporting P-type ATPase [Halomonas sp. McH1-25]|uniref:cation-transporting P-type ATPase n=1 Tax=unclassified Halomonas TaxID=2609666 RepID=UPI001EF5BFE7|nr:MULTISPECIES: cation-transporting P-type ATPase [unclassified Halomonas]MCG7600872.1 cation-transporting P-type ATPase [Halomonas sp. McH1-25]MCP1341460.1 cation-transporting P-type ATPase [Halomonas sp. FL8]MCP1360051.1 cation-transporting P-type ATPase [Halomonas sp. BBD45]
METPTATRDTESSLDSQPGDVHAQPVDEVIKVLKSSPSGLTEDEATRRLASYGRNQLPAVAGRHPLFRFLRHFHNALIYFLIAAAIAALLLGHIIDAAVIVAVVVINAVVGFVQEGKAEKALNAIRNLIAPHAHLVREGRRVNVPVDEIVPGDIVTLEAGDRVPADLRLMQASSLRIEEAILTGESIAAEKRETPAPKETALGDRHSMAYSGTLVATGQATGVVVATGSETEIGRISTLLREVQPLTTPLLRQINRFGTQFTWITLGVAAALFAFAVLVRGYAWPEALIAVVALAVGAIPEGLPAVITITLAIGVQRMARRNAAIRQLPAVETLGATSVICSDKTGTLTRNEMTVRQLDVPSGRVTVSGSGYVPEGRLEAEPAKGISSTSKDSDRLILAGLLCNDAQLSQADGEWHVIGDPMEGALVALAIKAGLDPERARHEWTRLDQIPFDAKHRFMATLNRSAKGERHIFVKGAPDELLQLCSAQPNGEGTVPLDRDEWTARIADAAAQGERVLGVAVKPASSDVDKVGFADLEEGLVFIGLVGFIDPPRDEAIAAIEECHSAGIAVKMITGDHATTAAAIARQLGLGENPRVLTGRELDAIPDGDLPGLVAETSVFARTNPEHKLRIVRALQASGAIVAMTGDGVNDAPSLKQADVGIGMGHKGTDAAKEASQMVLLDDNFASIVSAVNEGRVVYDNIRKVAAWTLPTNGGEVLAVIAAILFNFAMPMSAVQILWINLVTAATLGLALAFEPAEPNVMRRRPRPVDQGLLTPFLIWRVVLVSFLFLAAALGVFFYSLGRGDELAMARTLVVNTIVVLEIFYLFNVRFLHMTSFHWRGVLGTPAVLTAVTVVVIAQCAFTYLPLMQGLFDTRPVALADGILILVTGIALMIVLELEKVLRRRAGWLRH